MSIESEEMPEPGYWAGFQDLFHRIYAWILRRMPTERQRLLAVTILARLISSTSSPIMLR